MPDNPVLYYRNYATRASQPGFDSVDKLLRLRPAQCIEFTGDHVQINRIHWQGRNNTLDEPQYSSGGDKSIHKQEVGTLGKTLNIRGIVPVEDQARRNQMRNFAQLPAVEAEYHRFGPIGFFHPGGLNDFSLDPTNVIGYTMDVPDFEHDGGSEIVSFSISLSLGVLDSG